MSEQSFDVLIIGGGVAGLSAAAELSKNADVLVVEAEEQVGSQSSGRSATMLHYALGDSVVRALTLASRAFFEAPPDGFAEVPLGAPRAVLVHARASERQALDALAENIAPFAELVRVGPDQMKALCPVLRVGRDGSELGLLDRHGIRLDTHALLQGYARRLRRQGGSVVTGARLASIAKAGGQWRVRTATGERYCAPLLVNAAGAWADEIARLAGVAPLGLQPLRRTVITFDPPIGVDAAALPFTKTVGDELYFAPESGRLLASPMDEVPSPPCDAQPDEYGVALAAQRVEERTTMRIARIHSRWAGLRTFAPDRRPVAGFASGAEGFFWLAGQGGFGLQTSPAMSRIAAALITGGDWPVETVAPEALGPDRFLG